MKLTQTQRDKIYNIIYDWIFENIYKIEGYNFITLERTLNNELYCIDFRKVFDYINFKLYFNLNYLGYDDRKVFRSLKDTKKRYIFIELIDMPSKTLKDYYKKVKPQYINHLENPEEFPLESIQIGFYI